MKKSLLVVEPAFYIIVYLAICSIIFISGPLVQMRFGHDVICVLDGAWRIQNGQSPHTDFSSILGAGYLGQQYLFLQLFNYNLLGISVSSIVLCTISLFIFFSILYKSQADNNYGILIRIYTFLLIVSLGLGQYHIGMGFKSLTYANLYNRYGFLILLTVFLVLNYIKQPDIARIRFYTYCIVLVLLLNYLFFLKLTYFLVAAAVITYYVLLQYLSIKKYITLVFVWSLTLITCAFLFRVNVLMMLNDYLNISKVHTDSFFNRDFLISKLNHKYNIALILAVSFLIYQLIVYKASVRVIGVVILLLIFSMAFHLTNFGEADIVLLLFIPCFFAATPFKQYSTTMSHYILMMVGCIFFAENFLSVLYVPIAKKYARTEIKGNGVSGLHIFVADGYCNDNYTTKINEGVNLINKYKKKTDKIFAYDFDNAFSILTNTVPPIHNPLVWQYGMTFSNKLHPDARMIFKETSLIMIPKCPDPESSVHISEIYNSAVSRQFKKVSENAYWTLLRKI